MIASSGVVSGPMAPERISPMHVTALSTRSANSWTSPHGRCGLDTSMAANPWAVAHSSRATVVESPAGKYPPRSRLDRLHRCGTPRCSASCRCRCRAWPHHRRNPVQLRRFRRETDIRQPCARSTSIDDGWSTARADFFVQLLEVVARTPRTSSVHPCRRNAGRSTAV